MKMMPCPSSSQYIDSLTHKKLPCSQDFWLFGDHFGYFLALSSKSPLTWKVRLVLLSFFVTLSFRFRCASTGSASRFRTGHDHPWTSSRSLSSIGSYFSRCPRQELASFRSVMPLPNGTPESRTLRIRTRHLVRALSSFWFPALLIPFPLCLHRNEHRNPGRPQLGLEAGRRPQGCFGREPSADVRARTATGAF
jgi:hypothetical protein